jgi:hypothetical protein
LAGGGGVPFFKGGGGGEVAEEGGSRESGDAWRWSGGERGGPGRDGGMARQPAAAPGRRARARRCRVTVEGSEVRATRYDIADRWAGTRWGPVVSGWVRGRGSAVRCRLCGT